MELVWPSRDHLPGYVDALKRGWSPDNLRGQRAETRQDPRPGYVRWMWDGEFCGSTGFRWQRGTEALPRL